MFAEDSAAGEGYKLYEALIQRDGGMSFAERLTAADLESPFTEGKTLATANNLYRYLTGKDYYTVDGTPANAA